ncbi:MAG: phospholipase D family protein [Phycisphaeraceae bacterium]
MKPPLKLNTQPHTPPRIRGEAELIFDRQHFIRVVQQGILRAKFSLDIATADFKAMRVPVSAKRSESIVGILRKLADKGVEIRVLHAGVPSGPVLRELRHALPQGVRIRRCPRLHAKMVIMDAERMYLGSANLTGAGLGAKGETRRNMEIGIFTRAAEMVDESLGYFNAIWEGQRCKDCGRHDICPVPLEEPRLAPSA